MILYLSEGLELPGFSPIRDNSGVFIGYFTVHIKHCLWSEL